MLKEKRILKYFKVLSKEKIIEQFGLSKLQINKIDQYICKIKNYNYHTNIVGHSTLVDPWKSHVLDSIQIIKFINNKKDSILDLGTGAGLPGLVLAINNFTNVSLIDSNIKKIRFIKSVCLNLNIKTIIYHQRIESLLNKRFDYLIARALSNINKLFFYSQKFLHEKSVLIFLKGHKVQDEINEASKYWKFHYKSYQSISDKRGNVVIIRGLNKINE